MEQSPKTPLQYVTEKCHLANPSIKELKFGCEIKRHDRKEIIFAERKDYANHFITACNEYVTSVDKSSEYEIIGRPIQLADVLLVLDRADGRKYCEDIIDIVCKWDLTKDLHSQSEETVKAIAELLGYSNEK